MPLDHYVSQVHLRNFYASDLNRLRAIRKSDLKRFECRSEDVCRIEEGSTNAYLIHDRAVEEFLRSIEPTYNAAVAALREGEIDSTAIHSIAGFASYIGSCTPTAMRIHSQPLQAAVEAEAAILDRSDLLPRAPESLGGKSLTELLKEGTVGVTIDPKFPQALGIATIIGRTLKFGNFRWEILRNTTEFPFFTSDHPLALEPVSHIPNWIVPLTPDSAVRIIPDARLRGVPADPTFGRFSFVRRTASADEVQAINSLLVQCAEEIVFYRDDRPWVEELMKAKRHFRLDIQVQSVALARGIMNFSTQKIVPYPRK